MNHMLQVCRLLVNNSERNRSALRYLTLSEPLGRSIEISLSGDFSALFESNRTKFIDVFRLHSIPLAVKYLSVGSLSHITLLQTVVSNVCGSSSSTRLRADLQMCVSISSCESKENKQDLSSLG